MVAEAARNSIRLNAQKQFPLKVQSGRHRDYAAFICFSILVLLSPFIFLKLEHNLSADDNKSPLMVFLYEGITPFPLEIMYMISVTVIVLGVLAPLTPVSSEPWHVRGFDSCSPFPWVYRLMVLRIIRTGHTQCNLKRKDFKTMNVQLL